MNNNKADTNIKNQENTLITNNPELDSQKSNLEEARNDTPKEPEQNNLNKASRENVILSQNSGEYNKNKELVDKESSKESKKKLNQNEKVENGKNIKNYKYLYIIGFIILIIACGIPLIYILFKPKKKDIKILDDEENEIFIEDNNEEILNKKYKAIISIDFGSSFSGFSIAYGENAIESKLENIQPTTIVIVKNNLTGYRYGYDAENFMNEPRSEEYIYFDRIKTKLDLKFVNDVQSKIYIDSKYPLNYKINLRIIIKEYLRLFSDDALKYYNNKGDTHYNKNDIKWVVTVPAIWNEYGKQFMRNCAKKAGMNNIIIALEPEAASLTMFKDDIVEKEFKEKGKIFMLIDTGGYTLDITINKIIDENGNLKQLSPPSGGAYGSMNINDYLIKLVEEVFIIIFLYFFINKKSMIIYVEVLLFIFYIFILWFINHSKEKIDDLRENRYDLWKITLDSIENKKKELKNDGSDSPNYKIDIRLDNICKKGYIDWIFGNKKCVKEISYGKVEFDNKYLYVPKDIMKKILLKNIDKIIQHIRKLINEFQKIDLLVLTGGFAK